MWKLVIVDDQGQRTVVNLVRDEYTVGRANGHAVRLTERNISRKHAQLSRTQTGFKIEDLSSYNGVHVNGVRLVGRQDLAHSDLIQLGDYRVHVVDEAIETQEQGYRPYPGEDGLPASGQLSHRLVELIGPTQGAEYPFDGDRFLLGRGPECEFVIDHGSVSRVHAEIRSIGEDRFEILDKGSANGLRVNGRELNRAILDSRDVIEVGDVVLKYIPRGQVFRASATESTRIAALAASAPPPSSKSSRNSLAPSIIAAAIGAVVVGIIAITLISKHRERSNGPKELAPATQLLRQGQLLEAGKALESLGSAERTLAAYEDIELRWARAVLAADPSVIGGEKHRRLLNEVAKRESLPPPVREDASRKLSALSDSAIDLTALDDSENQDLSAGAPKSDTTSP